MARGWWKGTANEPKLKEKHGDKLQLYSDHEVRLTRIRLGEI